MPAAGVYFIVNQVTGKIYIGGSAASLTRRWNTHLCELRGNKHKNSKLQNSFNKHGEAAFVFEVVEECNRETVTEREQHWLNTFLPHVHGYNISALASRYRLGVKHTDATRAKISTNRRGKTKGIPHGPMSGSTKLKLSNLIKGRSFHSLETRLRIGEASRRSMRTPQWCTRISEGQRGRKLSPNQVEQIRQFMTGRKPSQVTLERRRQSMLATCRAKKASSQIPCR